MSDSPLPPFDEIYNLYRGRLYRFCLLQLRDPDLAEEIAADTWVAAYAAYPHVKPSPDTVHLWLFRIAKNRAKNVWRNSARWKRLLQSLTNQQASGTVEAIAMSNETGRQLLALMKKLSTRDRKLLALRFGAELSMREVAQLMGMRERTAAVATLRALERLRKHAAAEETAWVY